MRYLAALVLGVALVGIAPAGARAADVVQLSPSFIDEHPCVAFTPAGKLVVAFTRAGHEPGIWIASDVTGQWRVRRELPDRRLQCIEVAVDGRGKLHLLTLVRPEDGAPGTIRYFTNRSGRWSSATLNFGWDASLAITASGRAVIAGIVPAGIRISSNQSGRWRSSTAVPHRAVSQVSSVRLSPAGVIHVAYTTSSAVRYATNAGGRWRTFRVASSVAAGSLDLALDGSGRATVAYQGDELNVWVRGRTKFRRVLSTATSSMRSIDVDPRGRIHLLIERSEAPWADVTNRSAGWRTQDLAPADHGSLALDRSGRVAFAAAFGGSISLTSNAKGAWTSQQLTQFARASVSDLGVDGSGRLLVLVIEEGVRAGVVLFTNDQGSWRPERIVDGPVSTAAVEVDGSGRLYVLVSQQGAAAGLHLFTHDQGRWRSERIADGRLAPMGFDVTAAGVAHLAFATDDGLRRYGTNASGSWVVSDLPVPAGSRVTLRLDLLGSPHVFYESIDGLTELTGGPPWTATRIHDSALGCTVSGVDGSGSFHLVCRRSVHDLGSDYLSNVGGGWTIRPVIECAAVLFTSSIAVSLTGQLYVGAVAPVGARFRHTEAGIVAIHSDAGWRCTDVTASTGSGPMLAIDSQGVAHAVSSGGGIVRHYRESGDSWSSERLPLPAARAQTDVVALPTGGVAAAATLLPDVFQLETGMEPVDRYAHDAGVFLVMP